MYQENPALGETSDGHAALGAAADPERDRFLRAARVLGAMARTDAAGAAVRVQLERAGIEHLVIKGRAFADRLYRQFWDRPYADTDIIIRLADRVRAEHVLEALGYARKDRDADLLGGAGYSHTFVHGDGAVIDLHWNLSGAGAAPEVTWELLCDHSRETAIGGLPARVPDDGATALIVVLHNAHHGARWPTTKPDLDRAASMLAPDAWRCAQGLARRLGAEEAFAAGLALSESGRELAHQLGADATVSLEYRLRADPVSYRAWALHRATTARGARARARVVAEVILPAPTAMRQSFTLARRGPLGLALAYLLRPIRLATGVLPSLAEYVRARKVT